MNKQRRSTISRNVLRVLVVMACGIFLCVAGGLAGQNKVDRLSPDLRAVIEEYGLTVGDSVPAGVQPLSVTSLTQLQEVIESIRVQHSLATANAVRDTPAVQPLTTYYSPKNLHFTDTKTFLFWHYNFNLDAIMWIGVDGSFHWIDHISAVRVYLSGFHPSVSLDGTWTDSLIEPDRQYAWVMGGGTLNYYLFYEGMLIYYSETEYLEAGVPLR